MKKSLEIKKFLGLNTGAMSESSLVPGECVDMCNYKITSDYKLTKREGFECVSGQIHNNRIDAMIFGRIGTGAECFYLVAHNAFLRVTVPDFSVHWIASLSTAYQRVFMFFHQQKLYILTGAEYYCYNGVTLSAVEGYRPLAFKELDDRASRKTPYEPINLLTNKKRCHYRMKQSAWEIVMPEQPSSIDYVIMDGVIFTGYTVSTSKMVIKFPSPTGDYSVIEVGYTVGGASGRSKITSCNAGAFFSGRSSSDLFVYKDYIRYSTRDGMVDYFPEPDAMQIGTGCYNITDIISHYNRQIIFTENETFYSYDTTGSKTRYPVFSLNNDIGNKPHGMVKTVGNYPILLDRGMFGIVNSGVRDERNLKNLGQRIQNWLNKADLSNAVTAEFFENKEYFICIGDECMVYNYELDVFYLYKGIKAKRFFNILGTLYFLGEENILYRLNRDLSCDKTMQGDKPIECRFVTAGFDFGSEDYKYFSEGALSIKTDCEAKLSLSVKYDDQQQEPLIKIDESSASFVNSDFGDTSFSPQNNVKYYDFRLCGGRNKTMKYILNENTSKGCAVILSLSATAITTKGK